MSDAYLFKANQAGKEAWRGISNGKNGFLTPFAVDKWFMVLAQSYQTLGLVNLIFT